MIASLPMYDWPELRPATDALWRALAAALSRRGISAPSGLDREGDRHAQWRDPALLLSQTCGYPFVTALKGWLRLVAVPIYTAEGCAGPSYRSVVLVRADDPARGLADLRGRIVAYNSVDSQSGYSAMRALAAPLAREGRFFAAAVETGSHLASMEAVADAGADCAAIDCVCWAMAEHYRGDLASRLRVIAWSPPAPALPFVTSARRSELEIAQIRAAVLETLADPATADVRRSLFLAGAEIPSDAAYDAILAMEAKAVAAGYPALG
ncbi:PhnD/SsuA/transferrin family substrate-binding protein [Tepidamorphus gemmatus]|nr:PhnD/SsuA/transferrin family substrate-binding protein [Tepidamorphus gemmatus]